MAASPASPRETPKSFFPMREGVLPYIETFA
jgi:hypothetical protein